jgi:hypothetical protein
MVRVSLQRQLIAALFKGAHYRLLTKLTSRADRCTYSETRASPLDLLNKIIGAVIAYGPKNKTKKARKARKAARRKKIAAEKLAKTGIRGNK